MNGRGSDTLRDVGHSNMLPPPAIPAVYTDLGHYGPAYADTSADIRHGDSHPYIVDSSSNHGVVPPVLIPTVSSASNSVAPSFVPHGVPGGMNNTGPRGPAEEILPIMPTLGACQIEAWVLLRCQLLHLILLWDSQVLPPTITRTCIPVS